MPFVPHAADYLHNRAVWQGGSNRLHPPLAVNLIHLFTKTQFAAIFTPIRVET